MFHTLDAMSDRTGNANAVKIVSSEHGIERGTELKIAKPRNPFDPATLFADHFHRLSKTSGGTGKQEFRGEFPLEDFRSDSYMKTLHHPRMLTYRRLLSMHSQVQIR